VPLRPLSNESINKCLALLSRILDDAVERGYLRDNPARRVRRLRHHRPRRPVLEPHEVRAMFEAADRLDRRATGLTDKVLQVADLRGQGMSYPQIAAPVDLGIDGALPPVPLRAGRRSDCVLSRLGADLVRGGTTHR